MQTTEETDARLIADELVGLQKLLDAQNIRTISKMEPLLYRRLRDQAKREGTLETYTYFDALDGAIYEDSFDSKLGSARQASMTRATMRIIIGTTLRSRSINWAAKRLEARINRRVNKSLENPPARIRVEIGEFAWPKYEQSEPRLTFRFWKEVWSVSAAGYIKPVELQKILDSH